MLCELLLEPASDSSPQDEPAALPGDVDLAESESSVLVQNGSHLFQDLVAQFLLFRQEI
jgi:hypothetical protein